MKKKILMIASTWNTSIIEKILNGVLQCLEKKDVEVYIFNAYDDALESDYHLMEREIYFLPDVEEFDGVLMALNSVGNQEIVEKLVKHYHSQGKKILSMDLEVEGVPSIGTDNYGAEYELVAHLIEKHGCKVMNYLGGPEEHPENQERYRAFCDCLHDHGLTVEPERVVNRYFNVIDGIDTYHYFKAAGLHLPDAIVCANDNMALGYATAAAEDGYLPPKDFKIVGFDNVEEGQNYYPSITSVDRCWEQLGYDSMKQLLEMMDGAKPKEYSVKRQRVCINESCGCHENERNFHDDFITSYKKRLSEAGMNTFNRMSRTLLCGSSDLTEFQQHMESCKEMQELTDMAVFVNPSMLSSDQEEKYGYDEELQVYTEGKTYLQKRSEGLLPKSWNSKEKMFFFAPLHLGKINFGYCVIAYNGIWQKNLDHRTFMESICLGLESIRQQSNLNKMNRRLEDLYVRDAMTGMYNRFGYESFAKAFFDKNNGKVFVAYLDMDNLKLYNDRFGHEVGDSAIHGITKGIQRAFAKDSIFVRMGGDEFLVIGTYNTTDEMHVWKAHLHTFLAEYSEEEKLPFSLSVSIGYVFNEKGGRTLEDMIWQADHNMYQEKQKKKQKKKVEDGTASKIFSPEFAEIIEKVPDVNYNVEEIFNTLRRYVPDITSSYGVIYQSACIESFRPNGRADGDRIRTDVIIYDVRAGEEINEYVIRFETGRGGFVSVTTGIKADEEWTTEMKKDIYVLAKTIFLLVGRATAMHALSALTFIDQMTGIPNARKITQIMGKTVEQGTFSEFCSNFINIKNMKLFNGRYGDKAGDLLIVAFANALRSYVGDMEHIARLGGDNFMVFLPKCREEEFLEHMRNLVLDVEVYEGEIVTMKVSSRIGYYYIQPGDDASEAMSNSSIALHYAQREDGEDFISYESYMKNNVLRIKELEEKAPEAILQKEFVVFYQPKADISEAGKFKLNGGEALVRWIKDGKMILPYEFIPILEHTGLITQVDFYVFERVCQNIREWKEKGIEPVRISSNFSRRHLRDDAFVDKIEAIIQKYEIEPDYLEIEITESYDLDDMEVLKKFEQRLHKLGIHLSVDDFGSGFSSLRMIKNIVSDTIKLDKSIIDGIGENKGDEVIVQHMIQMIQSLGKNVIAEGVENEDQADFLRENDCHNIQGYLFGKPMEKEAFEILLKNR